MLLLSHGFTSTFLLYFFFFELFFSEISATMTADAACLWLILVKLLKAEYSVWKTFMTNLYEIVNAMKIWNWMWLIYDRLNFKPLQLIVTTVMNDSIVNDLYVHDLISFFLCFTLFPGHTNEFSLHKKLSFSLRISSVNVTKSTP